jgi:hypothetical protein
MTKQITIIQENASPLVVDDSDDRHIKEYTKELSTLLESNNVSIVETSSCSVIIRPNKIASIIVREFPSATEDSPEKLKETMKQEDPPVEEESPDGIISD